MRTVLTLTALAVLAPAASAASPKEVVEAAVKAAGGAARIESFAGGRTKAKGTVEVMGLTLEYTQELLVDTRAGKFKDATVISFMGQKIDQDVVFDGKAGQMVANGQKIELADQLLTESKETGHLARVLTLAPLVKGDEFTLAAAGEEKVAGKDAVGVKVSAKGFRDVTVYFDKGSKLPVKVVRKAFDLQAGKEVTDEDVIGEYTTVKGVQLPKKRTTYRDGKKFVEQEVVEADLLETVDAKAFAKPAD